MSQLSWVGKKGVVLYFKWELCLIPNHYETHAPLIISVILSASGLTLVNRDFFSDLVPREAVEKWLKYLREELPTVAFKCSTQEQRSNLGWKSSSEAAKPSNLLQTSDCLGADTLIKILKNYTRSHEVVK